MTIELAGAWWVLPVAVALLAVSAILIVLRLLKGPTGPDRVVAIDALTLLGVAAVALAAMLTRQAVLLDVAVVLALVTFLGTVAFALLFRVEENPPDADEEAPAHPRDEEPRP
ncbi:MAG TPA: monovalent cation/H+ antiporter complex subunit F [Rhodocyclaceae bacterium]|nr:monovalent cation/H+ antiporter complex subunit F [Rhodocyclaceae bacterium]